MSNRYFDEGFPLLHWATEIETICPKCGLPGVVNGNPNWKQWEGRFLCHSCSHSMKTNRDGWHGPVLGLGKQPCSKCGHKWVHAEKKFDDVSQLISEYAKSNCPKCNFQNDVLLEFVRTEPEDHAIDPFFGLNLALKESTRYGTVWVYNAEHLSQLKLYISAQLREGNGTKWSYFTRLPKWLKSAKNRALVLKAISKLDRRLITRQSR